MNAERQTPEVIITRAVAFLRACYLPWDPEAMDDVLRYVIKTGGWRVEEFFALMRTYTPRLNGAV